MPTRTSISRPVRSIAAHTAALAGATRAHLAAKASDLLELAGLAGLAVSVAGLTDNPWWGGLTGSITLVVLGIVTDPGRGPRP